MLRAIRNLVLLLAFFAATPALHAEWAKLNVVATTTTFEALVKEIGGDRVETKHVASPKFNIHFIEPKPSDVKNVAKADLYVNAGLDLEAWSDPLLEAAGKPFLFRGAERNMDLSRGIELRKIPRTSLSRALGDLHIFGNPHYAIDPRNFRIMAGTLAEKLTEIDPENAALYESNLARFLSKLDAKIAEWRSLCEPCRGKEIISYHDDIEYFADFAGMKAEWFLEPKPGIPPTPRHLESLGEYAKNHGVKAIVMPTFYPRGAAQALAKKIGAKVVTICQNVGEVKGTDNIFDFFDYNFRQISEACK